VPAHTASERAEQRRLREQMRGSGMSYAEIAAEVARRYQFRPRKAWRVAWGWTLEEAAGRYNALRAKGAEEAVTSLTGSRLSEWENWPLNARKPSFVSLCLLAEIYHCPVLDLIDFRDREHLPSEELLALDKTGTVPAAADGDRDAQRNRQAKPGRQHSAVPGPQEPAQSRSRVLEWMPKVVGARGEIAAVALRRESRPGDGGIAAETAGAVVQAHWPAIRMCRFSPGHSTDWHLEFPAGRLFDGGQLVAAIHPLAPAADGGAAVPVADLRLGALKSTRHSVLIGVDQSGHDEMPRLRVLNLARVRQEICRTGDIPSMVSIPRACALDDLSYAIMWATAAIDDALLADDSELDERQRELLAYEHVPESAISAASAAGLSSAARMWLGSSFCARHILRNLADPDAVPVFWTREQTGEEACTWLLFRHKYDYLKRISDTFGADHDQSLIRGFCIPEQVVAILPVSERILLLLAVAMIESLGISVKVCTEPDLADADGFVLLPGKRAVIATWVRAEGIWHAGITSDLGGFGEITGQMNAHALTGDATPAGRLRVMANYLALDWDWLTRRCAELAGAGCSALIQPHSRLLSTAGIDAAMRFLASMSPVGASGTR
jgi:hypothetical protein